MSTPRIALIGTEGSGKTVLVTVLATKLAHKHPSNIRLNPQDAKTEKYVTTNWNMLNLGEWVYSTAPGTLFDLKWKVRLAGKWPGDITECPMRIIDSAGQDLRRLFSDDSYQKQDIGDQDREFIACINESDILLILINLHNFIGESDFNKVNESKIALKRVLDALQKEHKRQIAIVFTACDLYEGTIIQKYKDDAVHVVGGTVITDNDLTTAIERFLEKEIPYLYNAHIADNAVAIFPVAAVADTEIKVDKNGIARRVPAMNFKSRGLDSLANWLAVAN